MGKSHAVKLLRRALFHPQSTVQSSKAIIMQEIVAMTIQFETLSIATSEEESWLK